MAVAIGVHAAASPSAPALTSQAPTLRGNRGVRWRQVFRDNFGGAVRVGRFLRAEARRWGASYPDGTPDTTGHGVYMPSSVVSIGRGMLTMHLHTARGRHMAAALVPTIPHAHAGHGLLYGRFVVRMRADRLAGYKIAVMLWPDSENWPHDGEIDFPEGGLNSTMNGFVHYLGATSASDQAAFATEVRYTGWHTTSVTWLRNSLTFQIDGRTVGRVVRRIPNTPMHLVIQTETQTDGPAPSSRTSGNVKLASVAVYTPACNPKMSISPSIASCGG